MQGVLHTTHYYRKGYRGGDELYIYYIHRGLIVAGMLVVKDHTSAKILVPVIIS